jgi:hypothetical protein
MSQPESGRAYAPPPRSPVEARAWHDNRAWRQPGAWSGHDSWQEHRSRDWQTDHRTWAQRGGYGGAYVPADRFQQHFGSRHVFRLHSRPIIENGYPLIRYGGYSFLIVDPWPATWGDSWYESDDLYIDYDDGYYLHDRRSPDVAIALTLRP